ncbi:MAG: hypothetical protein GF383_08250 [Candidatus Lokiarchaeota archaeon]|nr:hypothetical protein [Candidatus Lokiarchaeota archaeon]MBD3340342.1 hypothetical protein [Candidatus Lokiarchaeota archaeon]
MTQNEKEIIREIVKQRSLPYSLELIETQGDKYITRNNFGSEITYIKKDDKYLLEEE